MTTLDLREWSRISSNIPITKIAKENISIHASCGGRAAPFNAVNIKYVTIELMQKAAPPIDGLFPLLIGILNLLKSFRKRILSRMLRTKDDKKRSAIL